MMLDHQRIVLDDVEGQYKFAEASGFDFVCVLQHIYLKLSPWKLQLVATSPDVSSFARNVEPLWAEEQQNALKCLAAVRVCDKKVTNCQFGVNHSKPKSLKPQAPPVQ